MWLKLKKIASDHFLSLDEEIRQWINDYESGNGRIHCGKGCENCCNLAVNVTFPEALCALDGISPHYLGRLNQHFAKLLKSSRSATDFKDFLKRHRKDVGLCPFLSEERSCAIYPCRPLSCRSLLSTKNPSWCSVDFSELNTLDKQLYMESLDRRVVAFPVHYVKTIQDSARTREIEIYACMENSFDFSLSGNLCALLYLETEHHIADTITKGFDFTRNLLSRLNLDNPYLVQLFRHNEIPS